MQVLRQTVEAARKNSGNNFYGSLNRILKKFLWRSSFVHKSADYKFEKNEKGSCEFRKIKLVEKNVSRLTFIFKICRILFRNCRNKFR